MAASVALLAVLASASGLANGFVYDDRFIIQGNAQIHDLGRWWTLFVLPYWPIAHGGDGYRPLTLLAFALEWAVGRGSPLPFHVVNVALYAAVSIGVFRLARLLLPAGGAWVAAALFAVHPVHVEAVANGVGQSELWVGLIFVLVTAAYVRWRRAGAFTPARQMAVAGWYLAACLFKEHAIMLPVVLVAAELLLLRDGDGGGARVAWRAYRPFWLGLLLVAVAYVGFRALVIGPRGIGGFASYGPFVVLEAGWLDRVMTMLGVVPHWFRLLLFPARLSSEYGPPAYQVLTAPSITMLPGLLMLGGIGGLGVALRRRRPVFAFGLAWIAITLLPSSNFVLPSGILMAERTLFTPSAGAMLAIAVWIPDLRRGLHTTVGRIAALILLQGALVAGVVWSLVQSTVWRSNDTLFDAAVLREPMVYRTHYMRGAWLMARGENEEGYREFLIAMAQFPHDPGVPFNLGHQLFLLGRYRQAYQMYRRADAIYPGYLDAPSRMALMLAADGDLAGARAAALEALQGEDEMIPALRAVLRAAALQDGRPVHLIPRAASAAPMPR